MNIVVLLILTVLLYRLLFSNFGFMSEKDKKNQEEAIINFMKNINESQKNRNILIVDDKKAFNKMYNNYSKKIKIKISKTDKKHEEFDEKMFLKISEKAITKISEAFSEKNIGVLEGMLTKNLFRVFKEKIESIGNQIYKSVIVYFKDIIIENKNITKKKKVISLKVKTEQVNYIEDENGNIINGSKDKSIEITEIWTFIQNQNDNDNSISVTPWLLDSIDNVHI